MNKGIVTPEKNNGPKMTMPVKTRTPLEAFQMLRMGQPVDIAAGYYEENGMDIGDFHMLDKIGKLKKLAEFREMKEKLMGSIVEQKAAIDEMEKAKQIKLEHEKQNSVIQESKNPGGTVSNRGNDREHPGEIKS